MKELIIGEVLIQYDTPEELCEKVNKLDPGTIRMFNEAVEEEMIRRGISDDDTDIDEELD